MKSTASIAIIAIIMSIVGASLIFETDAPDMDTSDESDVIYKAIIKDDAENRMEFTDYSYKVYFLLDGVEVPDDDPIYEKATYEWKDEFGNSFTHNDGTAETSRTITIPSITQYFKGANVQCEIHVYKETITAFSNAMVMEDQKGMCVMVGGKTLFGDGKMDVCGGTVTVKGNTVTFKDINVTDTKDTWSGIIGAAYVRYDSTGGDGVEIVIEGTVKLESEHIMVKDDLEYISGTALLAGCRTTTVESEITLTGNGKLIAKGGQCAILINLKETSETHFTIDGLDVELYVTNSTFAYKITGCLYTYSGFNIHKSKVKAFTTSTKALCVDIDGTDEEGIDIVESDVYINLHCTIKSFGMLEMNAISSKGNLFIDHSNINLDYYALGSKRYGAIHCGVERIMEVVNGSRIEINAESPEASIILIGIAGLSDVSVDNSTLILKGHAEKGQFFCINCRTVAVSNESYVYAYSKSDSNTINPALHANNFSLNNSSMDLTLDCDEEAYCPTLSLVDAQIDISEGHFLKVKHSNNIAIGCMIDQSREEPKFIPGYVPANLHFTTSYKTNYSVNVAGIKIGDNYNVYETFYDMSEKDPVPAKDVSIGEKAPEKASVNYLYVSILIAVIVIAFAAGLYAKNRKKSA